MGLPLRLATVLIGGLLAQSSLAHPPPQGSPLSRDFSQVEPPGAAYEGRAFHFHQIRDGVFHAVGTGELDVICNSTIIVNEQDVLIVDSHVTPAAAWALQKELARITSKPIRYVVNTHYHYDHSHGNQAFGPDVEIIAHKFTRDAMISGKSTRGRAYDRMLQGIPARIDRLTKQLEAAPDETRVGMEKQLHIAKSYELAAASVVAKAPTTAFQRHLTLHRGSREIRLLFLGRGHTGGDVVVHLPSERLVITGDLLLPSPSYMGNAFLPEWVETLEQLKSLDFDTVVPGHGMAFGDRSRIDHIQDYLRDLWHKAVALHGEGVSATDAAATISMYKFAKHFGDSIPRQGVDPHAVQRVYELLDSGYEAQKIVD